MGQTADAGASLLSLGVVDIDYRRVSCSWPNKNITFKIDEASNFPGYLAFLIEYQQGDKDVTAVQLCETVNLTCKLLDRSHGTVWTTIVYFSVTFYYCVFFPCPLFIKDGWKVFVLFIFLA